MTKSNQDSGNGDTASSGESAGNNPENTSSTPTTSAESGPPVTPQPAPDSGKGISWLALVLSLAALGGAGYAWYQTAVNARLAGGAQNNRIESIEQRFADLQGDQSGVSSLIEKIEQRVSGSETGVAEQVSEVKRLVSSTETALVSQISEVKQQLAKSESSIAEQIRGIRAENTEQQETFAATVADTTSGIEQQSADFRSEFEQLTASIEALRGELGTSVEGWSLREIEHLLVLANQRLQLGSSAKDAQSALTALKIADQRLMEMNNPSLLATRQALSSEMAALSSIKPVDFATATSTLTLLTSSIDDLPMKGVTTPTGPKKLEGGSQGGTSETASTGEKITSAGRTFLADLASLVQVEKGGEPVVPQLSPDIQALKLAQGKLILEAAQVALVRQQAEVFTNRLDSAAAWAEQTFSGSSDQTKNWLSQLEGLQGTPLDVTYPDISGSLTALRSVIGKEG